MIRCCFVRVFCFVLLCRVRTTTSKSVRHRLHTRSRHKVHAAVRPAPTPRRPLKCTRRLVSRKPPIAQSWPHNEACPRRNDPHTQLTISSMQHTLPLALRPESGYLSTALSKPRAAPNRHRRAQLSPPAAMAQRGFGLPAQIAWKCCRNSERLRLMRRHCTSRTSVMTLS